MKKILALALLLCCPSSQAGLAEDLAYASICAKLTTLYPVVQQCKHFRGPFVIYSNIISPSGADGMYVHGEDYVFIRPHTRDRLRVVMHEMGHYVLYMSGISKDMTACDQEAVVRPLVGHKWGPEQRVLYGCK